MATYMVDLKSVLYKTEDVSPVYTFANKGIKFAHYVKKKRTYRLLPHLGCKYFEYMYSDSDFSSQFSIC